MVNDNVGMYLGFGNPSRIARQGIFLSHSRDYFLTKFISRPRRTPFFRNRKSQSFFVEMQNSYSHIVIYHSTATLLILYFYIFATLIGVGLYSGIN